MSIVHHKRSGLWFPECVTRADAEFDYMAKRVTDVDLAVRLCRKRHIAVQAGGNIGMWPLRLAKFFDIVHTFEAVPYYFEALQRNVQAQPKIRTHLGLLSDRAGRRVPFCEKPDGRSRVVSAEQANSEYETTTIDDLNLSACDALFLDVEGHEIEALRGASTTIDRFRPVITVEIWPKNEEHYLKFFGDLRYMPAASIHADRIYVPR